MPGSLCFRSAIMGYVHTLGFALNQSWSGMTSTLISSVVLMLMSTTAQVHGGTFMFFFGDTDDLDGVWYYNYNNNNNNILFPSRLTTFMRDAVRTVVLK